MVPPDILSSMPAEIIGAITNDHLQLIINPTEHCNLRCVYCYESFALGKMAAGVKDGVVNLVRRRVDLGLKSLRVEFFGGEPLLAWEPVADIAARLLQICKSQNVEFLGCMTTNGVLLTPTRLDYLFAHRVRTFQITLDGPKAVHNLRRTSRGGHGSYDAVWRCLKLIKHSTYQLKVLLRIHFDPSSIELLLGENGFIRREIAPMIHNDKRFSVHFHALGRWGGANDYQTQIFESIRSEKSALDSLVQEAKSAGVDAAQLVQNNRDAPLGEAGHAICYAARANAFVIRSDGRVGKCTVALEDDRNTIGRLLPEGDLLIDHAKHLPWLSGLLSGDAVALSCPAAVYLWNKQSGEVS